MPDEPAARTLAELAHCEGIAVGPDGMLWAGDEDGRIHRIDPVDGSTAEVATVEGWPMGLCVDGDGLVYVCAYDRGAVLRVDPGSGSVDVYCDQLASPNWPVFAPDGSLYVSESGAEDPDVREGRIARIPPGGGILEPLDLPPLHYANGLALPPDGTLFAIESYSARVVAVRDGRVELYAELPRTVPDGLALDEEGGLLVSCFQPNLIARIPPGGGDPEIVVDDWMGLRILTPTNLAFFGPERRSLAIASLCGWTLAAIDTPWRGQPLNYPRLAG